MACMWWAVGTESGVLPARTGFGRAEAALTPGLTHPGFGEMAVGLCLLRAQDMDPVPAQATVMAKPGSCTHSLPR